MRFCERARVSRLQDKRTGRDGAEDALEVDPTSDGVPMSEMAKLLRLISREAVVDGGVDTYVSHRRQPSLSTSRILISTVTRTTPRLRLFHNFLFVTLKISPLLP